MNKNNLMLLDDYMCLLEINNQRENTIKAYESDIMSFLNHIGETDLKDATLRMVMSWINSMKGRNDAEIKQSTRNRKLAALKAFYSYLNKNKGIANITQDIEFQQVTDTEEKEILTDKEFDKLQKILHQNASHPQIPKGCIVANAKMNALRDKALYLLEMHSGMRAGELVTLEVDEIIRYEDGTVEMFVPARKNKSKKDKYVQVDPKLVEYIDEYRNNLTFKPNNNYVFLTQRGNILTRANVDNGLKKYVAMAGINKKISTHCIRHTFATRMLADGKMDSIELADILGHADTKMIQKVYGHRTEKTRRKFSKVS